MQQKTIIFVDIDSTLVENHFSRQAIGGLLAEVAAAKGVTLEEIGHELWQENIRRQKENPNDLLTMDWDDMTETIARRYGVALSGKVIDRWRDLARPEAVEVLDKAHEVLRALRQPHRQLVIATKGLSKYQNPVLQAVNLTPLFDDILTPDLTGYLKTQPGYFEKYTQNGDGGLFIHIGDHYYDDVICARRNGFYSLMRAPIEALRALPPFERPAHLHEYKAQISTYPAEGTDIVPHAVLISLQEAPEAVAHIEAQHHQP